MTRITDELADTIKEMASRLVLQSQMNTLANEYYVFGQLSIGDKIPIDKFCTDLMFKGSRTI